MKTLNPQADGFITSSALSNWNFGGDRLSTQFWFDVVWNRTIPDLLGNQWLLLPLLIGIFNYRVRLFVMANLFLFLLPFLAFTNLHRVHNYYQYANGVFLLLALGASIVASLKKPLFLTTISLPILIYSSYRGYHERFVPYIWNADAATNSVAKYVRKNTKRGEYIIIFGQDWSPEIPYYSRRKALMNRTGIVDEKFKKSIVLTDKATNGLGAAIFCNHPPDDFVLNILGRTTLKELEGCKIFTKAK